MCNYSRKGIAQVRAVFPLQVGHIVSYESISTIWGIQLPLLISSSVNEKHQKTYEDHRFDPLLLFIRTNHSFIPFLSMFHTASVTLGSKVTVADFACQALITLLLEPRCPLPMLGEEDAQALRNDERLAAEAGEMPWKRGGPVCPVLVWR